MKRFVYFPSEKVAFPFQRVHTFSTLGTIFNYPKYPENANVYEHFCRNEYTNITLQPTSRKRKRGRSVFVEMIAQTLFSAYESEPLKIYHGLSFCFLWRLRSMSRTFLAFFFLERKRERK